MAISIKCAGHDLPSSFLSKVYGYIDINKKLQFHQKLGLKMQLLQLAQHHANSGSSLSLALCLVLESIQDAHLYPKTQLASSFCFMVTGSLPDILNCCPDT